MSKDRKQIAFELYRDSNGEMLLKDIAEKVGASPGTVRTWKSRDKWDESIGVAKNETKRNVTRNATEEKTPKVITELVESDELTEQQKTFCLLYLKYKFNQTKAYQEAFNCDYHSAKSNSYRLMTNDDVKKYIRKLKLELRNNSFIDIQDIINEYEAQFSADITDYVTFGKREIELMGMFGPVQDEQGNTIMKEVNYVDFNESSQLDGTVIKNVRMGKDGPIVELYDKQKAMDMLIKYHKDNGETQEFEDDGFLAALESEGEELWPEE